MLWLFLWILWIFLLIGVLGDVFRSRVTDSASVNSENVLGERMRRCASERGHIPNYVAVNFYDQGDLFRIVDELNGVR